MRLWISSLLLCLMLLPAGARGQRINYIKGLPKDTVTVWKTRRLDKRQDVRYRGLNRIIPTHNVLQFAGNMGLVSLGFGWDYGCRGQWETAVLLGYIPRNDGEKSYATFTLKETFIPWSISLGEKVAFEPLSAGLYLNSILSRDFWVREPDKYPYGYYGFSTKMRLNLFVGEGITLYTPSHKESAIRSLTLFYEFGATDLYVISAATNKYLGFWDLFGLSFGIKVKLV